MTAFNIRINQVAFEDIREIYLWVARRNRDLSCSRKNSLTGFSFALAILEIST